jgi:hypothetical protein
MKATGTKTQTERIEKRKMRFFERLLNTFTRMYLLKKKSPNAKPVKRKSIIKTVGRSIPIKKSKIVVLIYRGELLQGC